MLNNKGLAKAICIGISLAMLVSCGQNRDDVDKSATHAKSALAYHDQGQYRAALLEARNAIKFDPTIENNLLLATILMDMGHSASVLDILEPAKDLHADLVGLTLAKAYLSRGKYRSALELLSRTKEPDTQGLQQDFQAPKLKALIGTKKYEEAKQLLNDINERQHNTVDTLLSQLQLASITEDKETANAAVTSLRENYASEPKALFTLSNISIRANQLDEAENLLTRALSHLSTTDVITPQKVAILERLSQTLTHQGRFRDALIYQKLLDESNPDRQGAKQRYDEGIAEAKAGNLENAERLLAELAAEFPGHLPTKSLLGLVSLQLGDSATANNLFDEVIDPETSAPELINAAVAAKLLQNQQASALELLKESLIDNPNNPELLATFGLTALRTPSTQADGELAIQKALAARPGNTRLRLALAQYYLQQKLPEQASAQVSEALKSDPSNLQIQAFMLRLLIDQKETAGAIKFTHQLQRDYPDSANTWLLSALALEANKDRNSAIGALEQAISLDSSHVPSQVFLGRLFLSEKRYSEAVEHLKNALEIAPNNMLVMKGLLANYTAQDKSEAGLKILESIASKAESHLNARTVLAEYYLGKRDFLAAKTQVDKALIKEGAETPRALKQTKAAVYRGLAALARRNSDYDTAREHLLQALTTIPNSILLLSDLAGLEIAAKNFTRARQIIADMNEEPASGKVRGALLEYSILRQEDKPQKAIEVLETEWQRSKSQLVAPILYQYAQQAKLALQPTFLDDWIKSHKSDHRPHLFKAMQLQGAGEAKLALTNYMEVLKLKPEHTISLNNAAWLLLEAGEGAKARNYANRALKSAPKSPEIMDTAGWIAFKQGDPEGLRVLEKASELAPDNKEILEHYRIASGK